MSDRPSDLPPLPAPPPDEALVLARPVASAEPSAALPEAWLVPRSWALGVTALAAAGLLISALLWQKLDGIQQEVARRTTDNSSQAVEARTLAREAQETTRDLAARLALQETRLGEIGLQRAQLDELMQSLARSRDENLVLDVESDLRLAQQQALLTGSVQPLLAALKAADVRLTRAVQPRLNPLQRAVTRDIERIKNANVTDVPSLMLKLDELARLVDELPVANDPMGSSSARTAAVNTTAQPPVTAPAGKSWLPGFETLRNGFSRMLASLWQDASQLLRVSRIDYPEAALLAPEQAFFLRENLKLRLLNARLALLSRQSDAARADLLNASAWLNKYFDREARKTQAAEQLLAQVQSQLKTTELPRLDDTLAALATAAAAR
ncbi:MAG: uroporphyrinogen-III C-methyltransferase [Polaromonas sp.]